MKDELMELRKDLATRSSQGENAVSYALSCKDYLLAYRHKMAVSYCDQTIAKIDYMIAARTRKTAKGGGKSNGTK